MHRASTSMIARWLRRLADRLDPAGAPKLTHWRFHFRPGVGIVFQEGGPGCPVAYLSDDDYALAHQVGLDPVLVLHPEHVDALTPWWTDATIIVDR